MQNVQSNMDGDKIYYYLNTNLDKNYATLWKGYLYFKRNDNIPINLNDVDTILVDICNINFYIKIDLLHIYLSMDQDEKYYYYQFEKHINKVMNEFEKMFNISIINGIFNAEELRHDGNKYRYLISKKKDNKIKLIKKILNWEIYDKKNKKDNYDNSDKSEDLINELNKLSI